jgi:glycosyltransferase involved in cell wall biosynthesis
MMPNVYPGQAAKKHDIPYVVSPRGTLSEWAMASGSSIKRIYWPLVQRPSLEETTCFHATAESEYHDIRRMGFYQPVAIIPNGVDIPDTPNLPQNGSRSHRTLLFLGRVHPKKGTDILLKAWKAVQDRFFDWELRIVGPDSGGYLAKMKKLSVRLGLRRITFDGPLFGASKLEAFCKSELFVLPTHSENFGMAVAEALAAGVPAIVTKGAPWQSLEQHGAGWWIDIGLDPLVGCLEEALTKSTENLNEMGLRGRAWMEAEYSWTRVSQKMMNVYGWILNGEKKPDCVFKN